MSLYLSFEMDNNKAFELNWSIFFIDAASFDIYNGIYVSSLREVLPDFLN